MKKIFAVFSLLAVMALSSVTAYADIAGDGTEETPFLITNQGELELVTDFPDCNFRLENDVQLDGVWTPLCKETSSGSFTGVFDGAGHTISNLVTDGTSGGLFKNNNGTIKNLNIMIADTGMKGSGAVADTNDGTISNCVVSGNISGNFEYVGGICAYNTKTVMQCKYTGNVENTKSGAYVGGICAYNYYSITNCSMAGNVTGKSYTGGICGLSVGGSSRSKIAECYFIGSLAGSSIRGGVAGCAYSGGSIIDCYTVPVSGAHYGICAGSGYGTASYYDKTVSGLSGTDDGTPKSTAAMKMKMTYAGWDFENVWGMNSGINNGYPYLLWEYPDVEEEMPYTVNSIKLTDSSGKETNDIPAESFYFEINVTKNGNSKDADCLIIALYDESGAMLGVKYMKGVYYQNQTVIFGTLIEKPDKAIGSIKGFVWDSISGMTPLSNTLEI